jgi:hypothetical protein
MDDREQSLMDQFSAVPPMARDALIPDWVTKEAVAEDSWEEVEKKRLQENAYARDFRRVFPDEAFSSLDAKGKPTSNDPQATIAKAVKWLDKKFKGDGVIIKRVLLKAGLIDEFTTQILAAFNETLAGEKEDLGETAVKQHGKEEMNAQPRNVLRDTYTLEDAVRAEDITDHANSERLFKKAGMERRATIPPYGVIVTETSAQVYCRGKLMTELDTETLGGFAVVAEEVETLRSTSDVENLFGLEADAGVNIVLNVGQSVVFTSGGLLTKGTVTALEGNIATVAIIADGGSRITVQVPMARLKPRGSVVDNPSMQRADENVGESGDFDPANPVDMKRKQTDPNLDPASTVPGADTEVAPGTFTY